MNYPSCSHKGHLWKSLFCCIYEALKTRQRFVKSQHQAENTSLLSPAPFRAVFIAQGDKILDRSHLGWSHQHQKHIPFSVDCVTQCLKRKADFLLSISSMWVLVFTLAHPMGSIHSFNPWSTPSFTDWFGRALWRSPSLTLLTRPFLHSERIHSEIPILFLLKLLKVPQKMQ